MATTYRIFTRVSDGRQLQPVMGTDGAFSVPVEAHIQNVADAYSENPTNIKASEVTVLPDLSGALPCPVTPPSADDQDRADALQFLAQLDTAIANASNLADVKVVLTRLAKVVRRLVRNNVI